MYSVSRKAFQVSRNILPNTPYACSLEKEMTQNGKQNRMVPQRHHHIQHVFLVLRRLASVAFYLLVPNRMALNRTMRYYYGYANTDEKRKKKKKQIHFKKRCHTHTKMQESPKMRLFPFLHAFRVLLFRSFWSLFLCRHARTIIAVPLLHSPQCRSVGGSAAQKCQHAKEAFQLRIHPTANCTRCSCLLRVSPRILFLNWTKRKSGRLRVSVNEIHQYLSGCLVCAHYRNRLFPKLVLFFRECKKSSENEKKLVKHSK